MASIYSALKIELIGTGDQSGTWGSTTNTNLGTALEQAIVGKADITLSSTSETLTLTNTNALQNARALYLNLSGAPGGATTLNVPAIEKNYIVKNGTDQTVTIKVSGQTGVAIPTGKTALVYNNSTDVVTAVDYIPSLALGTALPASSGGTGLSSAGTAGNVLTSNGSVWVSQAAAAAAFDSGTVMLFAQTSAPTGWTKDTTNYNNSGLRVVTGSASTGGSVDFTTAFASQTPAGSISVNTSGLSAGATTLTTTQIPSHSHNLETYSKGSETPSPRFSSPWLLEYYTTLPTTSTGGGGSHTHSVSGSATATFTGTAINLAVKYVDVIRATKD